MLKAGRGLTPQLNQYSILAYGPHPCCLMNPKSVFELWNAAVAPFPPQDERRWRPRLFSVTYLTKVGRMATAAQTQPFRKGFGGRQSKSDSFPQVFLLLLKVSSFSKGVFRCHFACRVQAPCFNLCQTREDFTVSGANGLKIKLS